MEREIDKKNLVLKEDESIGTVQIADDVVDQGRKSRGSGQERNGRSGSDHGIRIQYSRNLSGSTAEGEKRH